jgi:hypothetical protein
MKFNWFNAILITQMVWLVAAWIISLIKCVIERKNGGCINSLLMTISIALTVLFWNFVQ